MNTNIQLIKWLLIAFLASLFNIASAADQIVRKSVFSLTPGEIEQYRKVVASMEALPQNDPRSWKYQSAIHRHFEPSWIDEIPAGQISQEDKVEMKKYAIPMNQHAEQNGTWDQCHQSDPDKVFLIWHRVYMHYFEQIARKVSNQPSFNLPYWDYTKGDEMSRTLPLIFREETYKPSESVNAIPNPLHVVRRSSINAGRPLDKALVTVGSLRQTDYNLFERELENQPHNVLHVAIGKNNTLLMGSPIWAAQDPIFWLHHSNLDRLWSCWLDAGNLIPPQLDDGKKYTFIDGNGNVVKHSVPEMQILAASVSYKYESLQDCKQEKIQKAPRLASVKKNEVEAFKTESGIALGIRPSVLEVQLKKSARNILFSQSFLKSSASESAVLTLKNIQINAPLGIVYKVNVRAKGSSDTGTTIGVISFFGKGEKIFGHGLTNSHTDHSARPFSLSFDASNALNKVISSSSQSTELELVFIPSTGVENEIVTDKGFNKFANPFIESISLTLNPQ